MKFIVSLGMNITITWLLLLYTVLCLPVVISENSSQGSRPFSSCRDK